MRIIEVEGNFEDIVDILHQNGVKNKIVKEHQCTNNIIITHESIISEKITQLEKQLEKLEITYSELTKRVRGFLKIDLTTGKYDSVDKFLENLSGYPINEWNEKTHFIQTIIHEDFKDSYNAFLEQLQEGIVPRILEYIIIRKDGEARWWLQFNLGSYDTNGKLVSISVIIVDNTDRKETEQQLKENEEKFRSIIEQSVAGIVIIENGVIVFANQVICNNSGYNLNYLQSLKPNNYLNLVHPDDHEIVCKMLQLAEIEGITPEFYIRIISRDNTIRWLSIQFKKLFHEDNSHIVAVLVEVTKRINLEQKLRNERDLAQKYFDAARSLLIVLDSNQIVNQINKRGCEILGYTKDEMIGKNWIDNFLPERVREGVRQTFKMALKGKICPDDCFENSVLTKNGNERIILWHNNMITSSEGIVESVISAGEDITDLKLVLQLLEENKL